MPMEFKEMLAQLENGQISVPLAYFHFKEMEDTLSYIKPLAPVVNDIYIKKSSTYKELSKNDLKSTSIAVLEDSMYFNYLTKHYPAVKPVTFNSISMMHKLLSSPTVDGFFGERQTAWQYLKSTKQLNHYYQIEIPNLNNDFHLVALKDKSIITQKIIAASKLISEKELSTLKRKWLISGNVISKTFNDIPINIAQSEFSEEPIKHSASARNLTKENKVNINLFNHLPPYIIEDDSVKGMLEDIIKLAFSNAEITIERVNYSRFRDLNSMLKTNGEIDATLMTNKRNSDYFYSDDILSIDNIVIAHKNLPQPIDDINDLKRYNVIGFKGANRALGSPFKYSISMLSDSKASYRELNSKLQIQALIEDAVDAVIIDRNIATWELAKENHYSLDSFQIYDIFPRTSSLYLAFNNQSTAQRFNEQFRQLKRSGSIHRIVEDYLTNRAIFKADTTKKLTEIIQSLIQTEEPSILSENLNALQDSAFINHISIDKLPDRHRLPNPLKTAGKNSKPRHYLNVSYNDENIGEQFNGWGLGLDIESLQLLDNFSDYQQAFNLVEPTESKLKLTLQEKDFIKNNPNLSFAEVDWPPLILIENGKMIGPIAEYLALISDLSGLNFTLVPAKDWEAVKSQFINGDTAIIPSVDSAIPPHKISIPYTEFNYAILTKIEHRYYNTMEELRGKTVVVVGASSPIVEQVSKQYPSVKILTSESTQGAITKVRNGQADAYLGHIITAMNHVQTKFPDLKIAGVTDFKYSHRFLVQKDLPLLQSIINKSIAAISFQQHQAIRDKWLAVDVNSQVDYTVFYQIIVAFVSVFIAVLFFIKTLLKANKSAAIANTKLTTTVDELTQTQTELNGTIAHLKSAQKQLIAAEKMASLGSLVAGIAHEINTPVGVGLTGISHFQAITAELTEKYQQQTMKKSDFDNYLDTSNQAATLIRNNLERTAELVRSFKQISVDQSSDEQRTFNVKEYIHQTLTSIHNAIKRTDIKIKVICDNDIVIHSYPGSLSQIVTNLVLNASIHAFNESSSLNRIEIKAIKDNHTLKLQVSDNGKGISPQVKHKIFDPFFTTNRDKGGSGLGLNIIFNLVTSQLKGEIACESNLGYGAKFIITFPTTFK